MIHKLNAYTCLLCSSSLLSLLLVPYFYLWAEDIQSFFSALKIWHKNIKQNLFVFVIFKKNAAINIIVLFF